MAKKSKSQSIVTSSIQSKAPWIYVSEPSTESANFASLLATLLDSPRVFHIYETSFPASSGMDSVDELLTRLEKASKERGVDSKKVFLIVDQYDIGQEAKYIGTAPRVKDLAIKCGRNFVSVVLEKGYGVDGAKEKCGASHTKLNLGEYDTADDVAKEMYEWLFTALPATEHVHLLTESRLQVPDKKHYPDYTYCTLSNIKKQPKDAKIQMGVVITSKPTVVPGSERLQWTVADKTGTGNFYFQYRGPSSKYTWDWVSSLSPGDIKSLPRMPSVLIREKRTTRLLKFPFRTTGALISGTGSTLKAVGTGLVNVGGKMKMGKAKEWVARDDVSPKDGKKVNWSKEFEKEGKMRAEKVEKVMKEHERVVAEKLKVWEATKGTCEKGSLASDESEKTVVWDEKCEKEFC